eukprot:EC716208.1.p5 GENE.EC716208.1~~EC716208.1.p5  ORF type:complete len:81 (+),score=19.99 EC716208.1:437-679(+)
MLQNNYPEILGNAIIIDAPRIFSWLWSAISFLLDKRTASKVCVRAYVRVCLSLSFSSMYVCVLKLGALSHTDRIFLFIFA